MTLWVDFNMKQADGRVPALLRDAAQVSPGDEVIAADGEGTACRARVTEILKEGRVALLEPIDGSWDRESELRMPTPRG
jgi:hypothetical protein